MVSFAQKITDLTLRMSELFAALGNRADGIEGLSINNKNEINAMKRRVADLESGIKIPETCDYILTGHESFSSAIQKIKEKSATVEGGLRLYIDRWKWTQECLVDVEYLEIIVSNAAIFLNESGGGCFFKVVSDGVRITGGRYVYRKKTDVSGENEAVKSDKKNCVIRDAFVVNPAYPYPFRGVQEYGCDYHFTD